jgi:poly(hydroxyalkanoate) depolymerase family esterase
MVVLVALLLLVLGATPAGAAMGPAPFAKHTGLGRDYYVYVPASSSGTGPRPLVVFLHGCTQTAPDAAVGTRWTELAESRGFVVVYPEQSTAANGTRCWNWFLPEHQARGGGEPAIIAAITEEVASSHAIDRSRIYVIGISAGADMAMIMGATYPDVYAAVGGLAGCAYATCADAAGQLAFGAMGARARAVPAFLVQGTADPLNNFAMGETMATQWVGANDLADDGARNGSVPVAPSSVETFGADGSLLGGAGTVGDPCVRNGQFPCAGFAIGAKSYPYTVEHHASSAGGCSMVDFWIVHGLSHGYPGGDPKGTFTDPIGPDVTTAAYDFFTRPCAARAVATNPPSAPTTTVLTAESRPPGRDSAVKSGSLPATGGYGPSGALVGLAVGLAMRRKVATRSWMTRSDEAQNARSRTSMSKRAASSAAGARPHDDSRSS